MHSEKHTIWIAQLALGSADEVPQDAAREIDACSTCAQRIVELRQVRAGLARAGAEQSADLAAARELPPTSGGERFRARLEELAAQGRRDARRNRRTIFALAASIAVVCLGAWFFVRDRSPVHDPHGTTLGSPKFSELSPRGPTEHVERFRWKCELPEGWTFTLRLHPIRSAEAATETADLVISRLKSCEWIPPPDSSASLPKEFDWRVQLVDDTGHGQEYSDTVRVSPR